MILIYELKSKKPTMYIFSPSVFLVSVRLYTLVFILFLTLEVDPLYLR